MTEVERLRSENEELRSRLTATIQVAAEVERDRDEGNALLSGIALLFNAAIKQGGAVAPNIASLLERIHKHLGIKG